MGIQIVPQAPAWAAAVAAFNQRLKAGGSEWGWYTTHEPDWLAPRPGQSAWREYYLAVEDGTEVRGAFALKPQQFWIDGRLEVVTDWQGPVSEGIVDPRYAALGLRLFREMQRLRPLLFSWGHGGYDREMPRMLRSLGFLMHDTPFCLRVLKPARFLRLNRYLRQRAGRRAVLDFLASSGLGWAGFRALQGALSLPKHFEARASVEVVESFGAWAEELWERGRARYRALAVRDAAVLNALMPAAGWPPVIRLKVTRGGELLGWIAVMDRQLSADPRFGELRIGLLVDYFAAPAHALAVIRAGAELLAERGVDLIFANQSHPAWLRALQSNGFAVLPRRRLFAASKPLAIALEPFGDVQRGLFLTNLDGHGPMGL